MEREIKRRRPAGAGTERKDGEFIFDRLEERKRIGQFLAKKRPFLIYGPSGVGKTLLLRSVLPRFHSVLYCEESSTIHTVFRTLAVCLLREGSPRARAAFRDQDAIKAKSAIALKGIVMEALREGEYSIVLDHLNRPSQAFASAVRDIMAWGSTPVSAVARSSHMEDTGFLRSRYGDRSQKCEIRNLEDSVAEQFAGEVVRRTGLLASNLAEFLAKVREFSGGNPGAILALIAMASDPKYRAEEHIKVTPLYIDFRMSWNAAG
jgi:hypothetical protein